MEGERGGMETREGLFQGLRPAKVPTYAGRGEAEWRAAPRCPPRPSEALGRVGSGGGAGRGECRMACRLLGKREASLTETEKLGRSSGFGARAAVGSTLGMSRLKYLHRYTSGDVHVL